MARISARQFADLLAPFHLEWPVAVAVSGGADSMALVRLMHRFALQRGCTDQLVALTIDHKLRPESTQEAEQVALWMAAIGIHHTTICWHHEAITSRIEDRARQARYALLRAHCETHGIPTLLTAHHACDQVETFWMRLARGSGLRGLCAIRARSSLSPRLQLLRPLLSVMPEPLRRTLQEDFNQPFLHDPSNDSKSFERVRWRKNAPLLKEIGLDTPAILRAIARLQAVETALEEEALQFEKQHIHPLPQGLSLPLSALSTLNAATAQLVLHHCSTRVSVNSAPVSHPVLAALHARITAPAFCATTALHCLWRRAHSGRLEVTAERRPVRPG